MPVPSELVSKLLGLLQPPPGIVTPLQPGQIATIPQAMGWFINGANTAWDEGWGPEHYQRWVKAKKLVGERMEGGRRIRARQATPEEGFFLQGAIAVIRYRGLW